MKLSIQSFGGVSPKTNPRYLDNSGAQVALNVEAFGQSVKPLKGLGSVGALSHSLSPNALTIYRFGQNIAAATDTQYWFSWSAVVDVCRSQIAGDAKEFTFFTGSSYPSATWQDIAVAGSGPLPARRVRLGFAAPVEPLQTSIAEADVVVPEETAAEVVLTQGDIDQINTQYGVKVSTDGGASWQTTKNFSASASPTVKLDQTNMEGMRWTYGVKVSIDGGYTWATGTLGVTVTSKADIHIPTSTFIDIAAPNLFGFALSDNTTEPAIGNYKWVTMPTAVTGTTFSGVVNQNADTKNLVEASVSHLGGCYIRAKTASKYLWVRSYNPTYQDPSGAKFADRGTLWTVDPAAPSDLNAQCDALAYGINQARTPSGEQLATAVKSDSNTKVTVTAAYQGGSVDLIVRWMDQYPELPAGTTISVQLAQRQSITAASLASALGGLTGIDAAVVNGAVKVSTEAKGADKRVLVKWGDGILQSRGSSGTTEDLGNKETRVYTYTRVYYPLGYSADGPSWESAPWAGDPSTPNDPYAGATEDAYVGQAVTIKRVPNGADDDLLNPALYPVGEVRFRLYRSVDGVFLYVSEVSATDSIAGGKDSRAADVLGEPIPSLDYDMPPDDLVGLINLPNGMMAGFTGRDVYFCEAYKPYAWPLAYVQTVDYPIVGLGRMDTTLVVLTQGTPYFMQGAAPDYITVVKSDLEQACVSKASIVSLGGAVIYASPDGLIMLSSSGSVNLTEGLFSRDGWQALNPSTIRAFGHDGKYIALHADLSADGVTYRGFVVDLRSKQFVRHDLSGIAAGFSDLRNDKLYLYDGAIKTWGQGSNLTGRWKSKKFSLPQITGFSCGQVEAESYTDLKCAIYRDGNKHGTELTNDALALAGYRLEGRYPFRLEAKQGRDWEIDLTVTQEVFNVVLAQSMSELANG